MVELRTVICIRAEVKAMTVPNFDALSVGYEMPSLSTEPVSRLTLSFYFT